MDIDKQCDTLVASGLSASKNPFFFVQKTTKIFITPLTTIAQLSFDLKYKTGEKLLVFIWDLLLQTMPI